MTKKDLQFDAIIAKNDIAKELAKPMPSPSVIFSRLLTIEKYIGEGNQPSVTDSYQQELNKPL
jgi:hypothetical protein